MQTKCLHSSLSRPFYSTQITDLRARIANAEADAARLGAEVTSLQATNKELRRVAREAQVGMEKQSMDKRRTRK